MTLQNVVDKFVEYPSQITNGSPSLAKKWGIPLDIVYQAKAIAKDILKNKEQFGTEYNPKDVAFTNKSLEEIFHMEVNVEEVTVNLPKILILDIETSPTIAYTWRRFQENISLDQVIHDPIILTWSAKWLFGTEMYSDSITPKEVTGFNDYRIVKSLWDLVNEADVVVAHYGDRFDIPMLNARAVIHGLPPFKSIKSIDTKSIASRNFKFPSNKLDALATYFGIDNKIKTDFNLWKRCLNGELAAIKEMEIYNIKDVEILEEVYLKLRPYIKAHPNAGVYFDESKLVCSICGGSYLEEEGYYFTNTGKFQQYRCACGGLTRGRTNLLDKDKKKQLLTSIPR